MKLFKEFLGKNPKVGNHFNEKLKENNVDEDIDIPLSDHFNEKEAEENGYRVQNGMHELHIYCEYILQLLAQRRVKGEKY